MPQLSPLRQLAKCDEGDARLLADEPC